MTIDHWLVIALIISTLIAPVIQTLAAGRITSRSMNPANTNADAAHPKSLKRKMIAFLGNIAPAICILVNIGGLVHVMRATAPVTRQVVFDIVLYSSGILFGIATFTFLKMMGLFDGLLKLLSRLLSN